MTRAGKRDRTAVYKDMQACIWLAEEWTQLALDATGDDISDIRRMYERLRTPTKTFFQKEPKRLQVLCDELRRYKSPSEADEEILAVTEELMSAIGAHVPSFLGRPAQQAVSATQWRQIVRESAEAIAPLLSPVTASLTAGFNANTQRYLAERAVQAHMRAIYR